MTIEVDVPESTMAALQCGPDDLPAQLRFAAASTWYSQGMVSQEVAAEIAGLSRVDFLLALARMGLDSFRVDFVDLDRELGRG